MSKFVFVVRYREYVSGEKSAGCGNFEVCYTDESKAQDAMKKDVEVTERNIRAGIRDCDTDITDDYAKVEVTDGNVYEWWIDKILIEE